MNKRTIADRKVFPIGLGVMALDEYKPAALEAQALEFLRYALQQGIELFDTADVYGLGRNEQLLGKALTVAQKEKILIATKGGCTRPGGHDWDTDGRAEHLLKACKESLQRLGVKQIYLYQLHAPDHRVPFEESLHALKELQRQKLIKHIGLSNVSLEQVQEAQKIITVVSVQNHFNLAHKEDENELLPYLTEQKIAFIPYFPLGSGRLLKNRRVVEIAQKLKITPSQVALAWILGKWPTAIPIPGTKNKEHLDENREAADVKLPEEVMEELNGIF